MLCQLSEAAWRNQDWESPEFQDQSPKARGFKMRIAQAEAHESGTASSSAAAVFQSIRMETPMPTDVTI